MPTTTPHPELNRETILNALASKMKDAPLSESLEGIGLRALLAQAVDADLAYMESINDQPYDDDDAFEAIADPLVRHFALADDAEQDACAWVDEYMEAMAAYLEESGLVDWMG